MMSSNFKAMKKTLAKQFRDESQDYSAANTLPKSLKHRYTKPIDNSFGQSFIDTDSITDAKQENLLKILSRFNSDMCIKELDVRLHSCKLALELIEQQKVFVDDLLLTLKEQRIKAGLLKVKQNQLESLKYYNTFPEDNKLAVKLYDFYKTDLKILESEELRSKGFLALVRESRYLSARFVDIGSNEFCGNSARLFLRIDDVTCLNEGVVKVSEDVKLWGCMWNFGVQLNKAITLKHRALAVLRHGSGTFLSCSLYCKPPKINSQFRYCNTTLIAKFSLLNKQEPEKSIERLVESGFEATKPNSWTADDLIQWEVLRTEWKSWTAGGTLLLECNFQLKQDKFMKFDES